MSKSLDRLKKLPGTTTEVAYKNVKVNGLEKIAKLLMEQAKAQATSQKALIESIDRLGKIVMASEVDTSEITEAIQSLKLEVAHDVKPPMDYEVNFNRDRNGLMKSGIQLRAMPKKLN